jgi:hypothetical protein
VERIGFVGIGRVGQDQRHRVVRHIGQNFPAIAEAQLYAVGQRRGVAGSLAALLRLALTDSAFGEDWPVP